MDYKSEYYQKDFLGKVKHIYAKLFFVGLIGVFIIISAIFSEGDEKSSGGRGSSLMNTFKGLTLESALYYFVVALFVIIALIIYLYSRYKTQNIIVGFSFSDIEMKIASRSIFSSDIKIVNKEVGKISIKTSKISDGLTSQMYECLIFEDKSNVLGYFLKNHFTWTKENEIIIQTIIDKYELLKSK